MHPLDVDSHMHHFIENVPIVGAMIAATISRKNGQVQLWQLVVAILGLAATLGFIFGSLIYYQARQQAIVEGEVNSLKRENSVQDGISTYIRHRQEINEDRISKLETESAILRSSVERVAQEHANISQAIANINRR